MVNSIKKGKSFEREIAKLLSEKTGVVWKRVPLSGAFATINKSSDPRFCGDVFTEDPKFKDVVVECKNYKNFKINDLFNKGSNFYSWIMQCIIESNGNDWVLFVKAKNQGVYVVSTEFCNNLFSYFKCENTVFVDMFRIRKIK